MDFYDVIEARRSVRGYLDKNVPDDAVARISRAVQLGSCSATPPPVRRSAKRSCSRG